MTSRRVVISLAIAFFVAAGDTANAGQGDRPPAVPFDSSKVKVPLEDRIAIREVWRPGEIKLDPRCPTDLSTLEP